MHESAREREKERSLSVSKTPTFNDFISLDPKTGPWNRISVFCHQSFSWHGGGKEGEEGFKHDTFHLIYGITDVARCLFERYKWKSSPFAAPFVPGKRRASKLHDFVQGQRVSMLRMCRLFFSTRNIAQTPSIYPVGRTMQKYVYIYIYFFSSFCSSFFFFLMKKGRLR